MGSNRSQDFQDFLAGVTIFFAMSYIIFTNPAILRSAGMAPGAVLLWTCALAGAVSIVAGWRLGTPTALACGMGLNVFFADYARTYNVPWHYLLATCLIVAVIVLLFS